MLSRAINVLAPGCCLVLVACGDTAPMDIEEWPTYGQCDLAPNYIDSVVLRRWPTFPVSVFIRPTSFAGLNAAIDWESETVAGLGGWQSGSLGSVRVVQTESEADVVVRVGEAGMNTNGQTRKGVTLSQFTGNEQTRAVITIDDDLIESLNSNLNQSGDPQTVATVQANLRDIAAHEMGHALGISGHSPSTSDLMGPPGRAGLYRLTVADRNTMSHAYCR